MNVYLVSWLATRKTDNGKTVIKHGATIEQAFEQSIAVERVQKAKTADLPTFKVSTSASQLEQSYLQRLADGAPKDIQQGVNYVRDMFNQAKKDYGEKS